MTISFRCDDCGKKLKAPDELLGRKIKCPGCQSVLVVVATAEPKLQNEESSEESLAPQPKQSASDDPFAADWMNSDDLEDPGSRIHRAAARKAQLESKQAELAAEEERAERQRKKKSKTLLSAVIHSDSDEGQPFRFHWIYALALLPLALSIFRPGQPIIERFAQTLKEHPEVAPLLESAHSSNELFMALPGHRIAGALLARDSLVHWLFGLISVAAYLGLLFAMFPGTRKRTIRLLLTGLFTGTIGILLLLLFQFIASATLGIGIRGRGLLALIVLLIQLIGFSYRCAMDPTMGFWGSFFGFTVGVGLCEELCKSLPIWHYLRTARRTGWRGACLTGLASGIGFGVAEGIMYSGDMYNGLSDGLIYLVRFVSCVSLHAMWSGSVALMMYGNQDFLDADEWWPIILGLLYYLSIAMILHGLYDTLLKHDMDAVALLIGVGSYLWMYYLVRKSRGS